MRVSQEKKEKISEQILALLYTTSPRSLYTSHIARELARDEDFIKTLLENLAQKKLIQEITKNAKGKEYSKRRRWTLTKEIYHHYQSHQQR